MSKKIKIWLITASFLILAGIIIFGGVMSVHKWNFTRLSTSKFETNNYEITEGYKNIVIVTDTSDIIFEPVDRTSTEVVCYERQKANHSVTVENETLIIKILDTRKWYEHIGINFGTAKITVSLPRGEYGSLSVTSDTGDVNVHKEFGFDKIDISTDTGDIESYASAEELIRIKTGTGDIKIEKVSAAALDLSVSTGRVTVSEVNCIGDLNLKVTTGKSQLTSITCKSLKSSGNTGDISLNNVIATDIFSITRTTGDVKLDRCDAKEIYINCDTGDVIGTLLSDKIFLVETNTGKVDVPRSTVGGRCEITTSTGDVKFSIE